MNPIEIIPDFDSIPLPGPVWLLKALLLLTFALHLIAMNMLFGGVWTALFARVKDNKGKSSIYGRLYRQLVGYLPTLVPATVTIGVAPLLFVQVLYGHLFYSSSIAMAWYWWFVWIMVIVAYYALYFIKFRTPAGGRVRIWILWMAAIVLLIISFIFNNNFNLVQQPGRFSAMIIKSASGWSLNWSDLTTFPRWLHVLLGALAVTGVWIMWLGRLDWKHNSEFARQKAALGYRLFAFPTMANILMGLVFMLTLPKEIMMRMMGRGLEETALWLIGLGLSIWALLVLKRASSNPETTALPLGTGLMAIVVAMMVILRDIIRSDYLRRYYTLDMPQTVVQWGAIGMFLIVFIAGLWVFYWLAMTWLRSRRE